MAQMDVDSSATATPGVTARDIIFSCGLCYKTVADVYKNRESNKGLSDGRGPNERDVTKLWLTQCAHLTCSEHLEGKGIIKRRSSGYVLLIALDHRRAVPSCRRASARCLPYMHQRR